jgi:rhamnogalacturonan endolyase
MCSLYPPLLSVLFSERAHPSDSRMATWGPVTYTVVRFALFRLMFHALFLTADLLASDYQGTSSPSAFPMAQFKNANNPTTIYFNVTAAELGARTLEIGTTSSFAGGRPQATINSFSGPNPTAPTEVKSRGVTRGTYRGNNQVYSVSIPAGTIVEGRNKIVINVISGSSGDAFLSPNVVYDFVRLY